MHGTNLRLASDSQTSPFFDPAAPHARQPKRARNPDREGALLVRSSLWCFACFLLAGRSRIPARREGVLEANGVFSRLIGEGSGLREQSGGCRAAAGLGGVPGFLNARASPPARSMLGMFADHFHQAKSVEGRSRINIIVEVDEPGQSLARALL
jgi:hypothetical protein